MNRFVTFAAASVVAALATTAQAQTVLLDMGNNDSFRGVSTPSPQPNGNVWNSHFPGTLQENLVAINGSATTIGIGWFTPVGTDSFNGASGGATSFPDPTPAEIAAAAANVGTAAAQAALGNLAVGEAAIDYAASSSPGSPCVFDLHGLDAVNFTYTLRLYGSHIFSDNQQTTYSVGSGLNMTTFALTGVQGSASINVQEIDVNDPGNPPNIPNTTQVAVLSGLVPNSGGQLFINFVGAQGGSGYLNDFELIATPVPEPTTLGACLGVVGVLVARRRSR
ncbi:MAG: PEP-CTERM sorting domain-containing protein [Anaerolineae bacterium]|nr:PEP-CTERM sorting domain-containing protein [Phycisphaerae bacterium]